MTLMVEEATEQQLSLRLSGSAALKSGVAYQFHGVLTYDRRAKAFSRWSAIAICDEGPGPRTPDAPYRYYGIAFELAGERTEDVLPPFHLREGAGSPERYFTNASG
jgi:hypothetical protein